MKCDLLILLLLISATTIAANDQKWRTQQINYSGKNLKLVVYQGIDPQNVLALVSQVDKSTISTNPKQVQGGGFIQNGDVIVCSRKLLMWFSLSPKQQRKVRSGGGLVSGVWEVNYSKKKRSATLARVKSEAGYTPNLLLPGSSPNVQLFGADVFGGYSGSRVVWGLEHAFGTELTNKFGRDILGLDRGPYASDNGVFVEFQGVIGNSQMGNGFDSPTDTDPRPGIIGKTVYTLTYRVPADKSEYIQEVQFKVVENNFGPISTAYMALYLPGYGQTNMVYATNPQLMPVGGMNLKNVEENKYFKNTCVKKIWFYEMPFISLNGRKIAAHTPEGRGRVACVGSPANRIPFLCGYPTNDFIPKKAYEEYTLEISDNQTLARFGRFQSINYKLINNQRKSILLSVQGKRKMFSIIMRYKVIDASAAVKSQ
jgi:hypothetical protein